jgi:hypothetical protein
MPKEMKAVKEDDKELSAVYKACKRNEDMFRRILKVTWPERTKQEIDIIVHRIVQKNILF